MGHHDLFGTMHVESTGHIQQMETTGKFNQIQDKSLQPRVNRSYTDQWSEYKLFWLKFGHAHANLNQHKMYTLNSQNRSFTVPWQP